jgi:UDP-galactopyranose mutase
MSKYDYLIVGAGLFGAVFARMAADSSKRCLVIDRRTHIAGNIYTERIENIAVHKYGAHIFHTSDKAVWDFVNRYAEFVPFVNAPVADFDGKMFNLPFNMNTFVQLWGVKTPEEARQIIESQRLKLDCPAANLEEQALSLAGRDIYETLIKAYTEKQWGRDCRDLPAFIIRRLPLRFTFDNNYFSDIYQGIPRDGYTDFVANLLSGIEVRTNTAYADCECPENLAERIIYTGMIDEFFGFKLGKLAYRTLRFENEVFDSENVQGNAVINYTSHAVPYTRSIEHRHFDRFVQSGKSVVTKEYPKEWQPGDEPYYPVNDEANDKLYRRYRALADGLSHVIFGGRLGEYKYYDMDKTVAAALTAAKKEGLV